MKTLISMIVGLCFVGTAFAQQPGETQKPGPEQLEMTRWCGDWTYTGKVHTSLLGPGGKITGKMAARLIHNGFATEGTYDERGPEGDMHSQEICWYQPVTKTYVYFFHSDDGYIEQGSFKIRNGNVSPWKGTCVKGDLQCHIRGKDTYAPDGESFIRTTEISVDGKAWQPSAEFKFTKIKSDAKKTDSGLKKLEDLVGDWTYEGQQADPPVAGLPYGPAGKYHGTFTKRYVLDGLFLENKIEDNNPSGRTSIVSLTGYNAETGKYTETAFISDGSRSVATATLDGRVWTSHSTMTTSQGKKVLIRTTVVYSSDWNSNTATTEVSPDNGKTWKFWFRDKANKVGTNDSETKTTREDFERFCKLAEGRWIADITLNEDWPGFGKKGETFTAYMQQTRISNGNAMVGRLSFGDGWIDELKVYDPDARQIITTQAMSNGAVCYLKERRAEGEWPSESIEFAADGTKSLWVATSTFSKNGKEWIVTYGTPDQDKQEWMTNVWHRISK